MKSKYKKQFIALLMTGALVLSEIVIHVPETTTATAHVDVDKSCEDSCSNDGSVERADNDKAVSGRASKKQLKRITKRLDSLIKESAGDRNKLKIVEPVSERKTISPITRGDFHLDAAYSWLNDTYFGYQWYINDISAQDVWVQLENNGRRPGSDIVVAVVDTGVDVTHPDLADNIWVNSTELNGVTGVDDDKNGYVDDIYGGNIVAPGAMMTDAHGHGTQMAGIIAMTAGNGIGGAGVAYGVKIMPVRVTVESEFTVTAALKGLEYAVNNGADIISMSFSSTIASSQLEEAMKLVSERCITVAASGNNGSDMSAPCYPAVYDSVTGVMSYGRTGVISDFSNWDNNPGSGQEYDIAAPGEEIFSANRARSFAESSGTSHATAVVSGAMAVVLSELRLSGKKPKPAEFKSYFLSNIKHTTTPDFNHNYLTYKKLNISDILMNETSEFRTFAPTPTVPPTQTPAPTVTPATSPAPTSAGIPTVPPLPTPVPPEATVPVETTVPIATLEPTPSPVPTATVTPDPYVVKTGTVIRAGKKGKMAFYRVTNAELRRVTYYTCNVKKTRKKAQVPDFIKLSDGRMYQVTDIRKYCFSNRKNVKKVTVYAEAISEYKMKKAIKGSRVKKVIYKNK
ncbi:MAG: S8 family serine peptidase [Eubacterium sp.]|nr:S8 family serine peptidase [Eubacterium sp.]